ncbi:hypothetical protein WA026_021654 [Henosepilachna vigintioctopunctata]|uniref:Major facilitator superfamily (MFS) profile domain-containing protein n=1 Tax=Henosepilachna vigintioctopunctata TaxID=420089 RepID=A0AAW1U3I9_9CUCU
MYECWVLKMFINFNKTNNKSAFNEYLASITACILGFSVGIHTGWTSPFIPKLKISEGYPFDISSEAASYIAIFGPIGDIIGAILSMLVIDRIGRKKTLITLGIPMVFSCVLFYLSDTSPILLYIARISGGITSGTFTMVTPIYISEISRPLIRGKLGILVVFSFTSGLLGVNLVGKYLNHLDSSLIFLVIILTFLSLFSMMPETPYYLLMKDNVVEAEKSLVFLRRSQIVRDELWSLSEDVQRQLSESGTFSDLFKIDSNKRALLLMISGRSFQQLTGAVSFIMYARSIIEDAEDIVNPEIAMIVITSIQIWFGLLSGILADKFGRIPLITFSTAVCFVTLNALGSYFVLRDYSNLRLPVWTPVLVLFIHFCVLQFGIGSLLSVMVGEFFSASIKPKALCIVNISLAGAVIITTKFYQVCTDYMHTSVCFFVFAVCCLIGTIYIKLLFPETNGKTLEQIQMELKKITSKKNVVNASSA